MYQSQLVETVTNTEGDHIALFVLALFLCQKFEILMKTYTKTKQKNEFRAPGKQILKNYQNKIPNCGCFN